MDEKGVTGYFFGQSGNEIYRIQVKVKSRNVQFQENCKESKEKIELNKEDEEDKEIVNVAKIAIPSWS